MFSYRQFKQLLLLAFSLLLVTSITSCGQIGPLYLPKPETSPAPSAVQGNV